MWCEYCAPTSTHMHICSHPLSQKNNMAYFSAPSRNIFEPTKDIHAVQKPKRRRKYVPRHMRSEESALKRNARERRRQCRINDALDKLNQHLPETGSGNKKSGKEGIIRRAIEYIQSLSSILEQTPRSVAVLSDHQHPDELPEPSPEFNPLPEQLFQSLMVEAQHFISSTQRWAFYVIMYYLYYHIHFSNILYGRNTKRTSYHRFKTSGGKYHRTFCTQHDDVIKWKHFPCYWPFVRGIHRPPLNSPYKGPWRGAVTFSLICVWINGWVNSREAGDLRRYRAHYDVSVMNLHESLW